MLGGVGSEEGCWEVLGLKRGAGGVGGGARSRKLVFSRRQHNVK